MIWLVPNQAKWIPDGRDQPASSYSRLFCTTGFIVEAGCYQMYQCNFKVGNLHLMKEKKVPQHHNSIKWVRQVLVSTFGFWWLGSTNK